LEWAGTGKAPGVEGGAIGLAALLARKLDIKGKVVVGVLSGGNVDAEMFDRLIAA
jgi:threonine dehydratase